MKKKERIIVRYLNQRWYKKALVITGSEQESFNKINALKLVVCSGYLKIKNPAGCIFDIGVWPFEHKFFDLIIFDESFVSGSKRMKILLNQLHFCLADDGEVVVASLEKVRLYELVSKFLANGFISKKLYLMNVTNNFIINMFKKVASKNFVVVFKKDVFFTADALKVEDFVKEPVKGKVCSSSVREIYGNSQKKK